MQIRKSCVVSFTIQLLLNLAQYFRVSCVLLAKIHSLQSDAELYRPASFSPP